MGETLTTLTSFDNRARVESIKLKLALRDSEGLLLDARCSPNCELRGNMDACEVREECGTCEGWVMVVVATEPATVVAMVDVAMDDCDAVRGCTRAGADADLNDIVSTRRLGA